MLKKILAAVCFMFLWGTGLTEAADFTFNVHLNLKQIMPPQMSII